MTPEARARRRVRTPVLVVTVCAWVGVLAAGWAGSSPPADHGGGAHVHEAASLHAHAAPELAEVGSHVAHGSALPFPIGWWLMLAAMMAPLLIPALRHVHARSLPRRRRRAVMLLVLAYAATWTAGGAVLLGGATSLGALVGRGETTATAAVAVVLVVVWQVSPLKQRCLNRHHAHPPLAAFDRAADLSVLRFGTTHAAWCFGSCWALMLLPLLLTSAHVLVMVPVTLWMWSERLDRPVVPSWRLRVPVRAARIVTARARAALQPA